MHMATLSIRLDDTLNQEFDRLCERKGYKKSGLIVRLVREFIERSKGATPLPAVSDFTWEGRLSLGGDALEDTEKAFDE